MSIFDQEDKITIENLRKIGFVLSGHFDGYASMTRIFLVTHPIWTHHIYPFSSTVNWKEKDIGTIEIIRGVRNDYNTKNYNINDIGDLNILLHNETEWIIEQIANASFSGNVEFVRNYIKFI